VPNQEEAIASSCLILATPVTITALYNKDCMLSLILASEYRKSIRLTGLTELGGLPPAIQDWLANASSNDCTSVTCEVSSGGRLNVYEALAVCPGRATTENVSVPDNFHLSMLSCCCNSK